MHDFSGQVIRGYELHEQIGAGGFGAVYRAFQTALKREVAVKVILPEHANQPDFVRRFEAEARLVAQLDHLHIVPLYDYWRTDDGTAFLVMRWLRGGSLRAMIRANPLSLESAVSMIEQICDALSFAHQRGIIHRDIKPDNILLDEHRNAYLGDFGIAKVTVSNVNITSTGSVPGTPAYAAPEQIGGGRVTAQTDLYALGITLYEALTGRHPFPDAPLQHLYENLPSVAAQRSDIPIALDEVIHRATTKRASLRFPDATSFSTALRAAASITATHELNAAASRGTHDHAESPYTDGEKTRTDQRFVLSSRQRGAVEVTPARRDVPQEQSAILIRTLDDIPSRPDTLIGRDTLLIEIAGLLNKGARVLLQGLGGMGKTSLAAETVAGRVAAGETPILWLRASGDDADQWMIALARPFDEHVTLARTQGDERARALRNLLKDQQVKLIVLDDPWEGKALKTVIDALPPGLPALITSRQRFPVGKILDVGELSPAQAVELLNYHAGESFSLGDKDALALCETLGWHPFTLEIAGKTLQVDSLTPRELQRRIANAPHTLAMPEDYAAQGRASVNQLLTDSVEALDADARQFFFAFGGLFVPQVTPELIAHAADRTLDAAESALTTLIRRGLIRRARSGEAVPVYTMHSLAFSYARAAPSVILPQVIAACQAYAAAHKDSFAALDAERSNILKAGEAAFTSGYSAATIAIMRALTIEGAYLNARGHDALLMNVLDKAVEAARMAGASEAITLHYLLSRRGNAHYNANHLPAALLDYQAALTIAEGQGLRDREVILRCVISKIYSDQQDFGQAEALLDQAVALAADAGDDALIARVLEQKGYHFAAAQDFENARQTYVQMVALAEKIGSAERMFFALQNLGSAETELAQYADAQAHLERALGIAREQDNRVWVGYALHPLGMVHHHTGRTEQAAALLVEALTLFRAIGNHRGAAELVQFLTHAGYSLPQTE
ncbi:MAG: protein kinase [bacterium]|nr:protein kinase [bacterium]